MTRGRWFVLGAFGIALAAAIGNLVYQHLRFRPAHDFWGGPLAVAIGQAGRVELLRVAPGDGATEGESLSIGAVRLEILESRDISAAAGLSQLRRSLLDRHSFDWSARPAASPHEWRYALRFEGRDEHTLAISDDGRWIAAPRGIVNSTPRAAALVDFCQRSLDDAGAVKP